MSANDYPHGDRRYPLKEALPFDCPACGARMRLNTMPVIGGFYHRLCTELEAIDVHGPLPCPKCHHPIVIRAAMTVFAERVGPKKPEIRLVPPPE